MKLIHKVLKDEIMAETVISLIDVLKKECTQLLIVNTISDLFGSTDQEPENEERSEELSHLEELRQDVENVSLKRIDKILQLLVHMKLLNREMSINEKGQMVHKITVLDKDVSFSDVSIAEATIQALTLFDAD